jgi:hypothetical protein
MLVGLANPPLDDGDNGTPLWTPAAGGDTEDKKSELRRRWWGVTLVYMSRGEAKCGRAGEREGGPMPGEEFL